MKALAVISVFVYLTTLLSAQGPATWSQSTAYTHPALVIDGTTTYLSLQNVPANTEITNTNYWSTLDSLVPAETPSGSESLSTPDASEVANLAVPDSNSSQNPGIVRVNVRGTVSKGEGARIVSFKLAFDNGSTTDTSDVLVRGIGPGLSGDADGNYNYASDYTPLSNPKLYVERFTEDGNGGYSGETTSVTDNLDWTSQDTSSGNKASSDIQTAAAALDVKIHLSDNDAAALYPFTYGFYTFPVQTEVESETGVAWVGADKINLNDGSRFTHASCRGDVGVGGDIMILSFEITGDANSTTKVLVQGRGPSLVNLNVASGYLNDTVLEIQKFDENFVGQDLVGQTSSNDDWTSLNDTSVNTSAKDLTFGVDLEPKDSALLLDLSPGYYTAKLKGANDTTGIGWVAVDEVE